MPFAAPGVAPDSSRQFPARALDFDSLSQFTRAVNSLLAAAGRGFLNGLFDRFPGLASALLNAAQQFFVLAFGELEIVIRKLGPLLFQLGAQLRFFRLEAGVCIDRVMLGS